MTASRHACLEGLRAQACELGAEYQTRLAALCEEVERMTGQVTEAEYNRILEMFYALGYCAVHHQVAAAVYLMGTFILTVILEE